MKRYYKERAPVYDRVYKYPERQSDLRFLESYIPRQFSGCKVIEIAAGTGYWTQFISKEASSILAIDTAKETLEQLERRNLGASVLTKTADAYTLDGVANDYNGAFAGLWLSHVPKQRRAEFLSCLHRHIITGSTVLFIDNTTAQCNRLPIAHTDNLGNTYQDRTLDSGVTHRVLKNFLSEQKLLDLTRGIAVSPKYMELENFWLFQYTTK